MAVMKSPIISTAINKGVVEKPKYQSGNVTQTSTPRWTDKNTEIERTKSVISDRFNAGQDLHSQLAHYKNLTGQDYTKDTGYQQLVMNKSIADMQKQMQSYNDELFNKQKESQVAALQASRNKAIGQLNQQKSELAPQYQKTRNQTDAMNLQNVQRLREVMANAGLTATGENVSANAAMNNQRVSAINDLNLQEQQQINDFDRRIADLNDPSEENAIIAALEAERSRSMMDAYNRAQDVGYGRFRDTVSDNRYADESAYQREQDKRQWEYQQGRDKVADSRYDQEFGYQKGRDKVSDYWKQREYDAGRYDRAKDVQWREYTYKNMSAAEKSQLEWAKAQYGEDMAWRMYEMEYNGELAKSQSQAELDYYSAMDFLP